MTEGFYRFPPSWEDSKGAKSTRPTAGGIVDELGSWDRLVSYQLRLFEVLELMDLLKCYSLIQPFLGFLYKIIRTEQTVA